MALDTSQRLEDLTVAELRQMARERRIKRYSKMRKAELVRALERSETAEHSGAERHGAEPERGGDRRTTSDHDEIRAWADARNATPATEEGTWTGTQFAVLRLRFPQSRPENLQPIDWPTWFQAFDTLRLRFTYLVPADGSTSDDFQLQPR
jgi:Rho termination factor, N-terminal domain